MLWILAPLNIFLLTLLQILWSVKELIRGEFLHFDKEVLLKFYL